MHASLPAHGATAPQPTHHPAYDLVRISRELTGHALDVLRTALPDDYAPVGA